jgi:hypothetical protein
LSGAFADRLAHNNGARKSKTRGEKGGNKKEEKTYDFRTAWAGAGQVWQKNEELVYQITGLRKHWCTKALVYKGTGLQEHWYT